jgi:hypothetical protein
VALSGVLGEHLAARGDFEPLGDGLLGFDSLRTTHKLDLFDRTKERRAYGGWPSGSSGILIILKPMTDLLRFSPLLPGDFPRQAVGQLPTWPVKLTVSVVVGKVVDELPELVLGFHGVPPLMVVLVSPNNPGLVVTASPSLWPLGSLKVVLVWPRDRAWW